MLSKESDAVKFILLTLYPDIFSSFLAAGLIKKAVSEKRIEVEVIDFRKHGLGRHAHVDASPYGGGAGMLLRPEPIVQTLEELEFMYDHQQLHKILISPRGKRFDQEKAKELSHHPNPLVFICGRFEGFDERIRHFVNEEISIGDFVLMGGEVAAMAVVESVSRLIPGVLGNESSLERESFRHHLLEHEQYTRPFEYKGLKVPDILLSGDHQKIRQWRQADAIKKTREYRHDLYEKYLQDESNPNSKRK